MSFTEHWGYVSDKHRLASFREAIALVVSPGDHVLDLGSGSGILGLLCLHAGAGRLTAIERTEFSEIARECLSRAGSSARIDVLQDVNHHVILDEPADVVICDHVGYFGIDYGIVPLLRDARERLLRPGGTMLPSRLALHLAGVESADSYHPVKRWSGQDIPAEMQPLRTYEANTVHPATLAPGDLITEPCMVDMIDLARETRDAFSWNLELKVTRSGILHGLAGWFDCDLVEGVGMTNAPEASTPINRRQAFFPLEEPLPVDIGDHLTVSLAMRAQGRPIAWSLKHAASGTQVRHNTLAGEIIEPSALRRLDPAYQPRLTPDAEARMLVLNACNGERTLREIEELLARGKPDFRPTEGTLHDFVTDLLRRYTT